MTRRHILLAVPVLIAAALALTLLDDDSIPDDLAALAAAPGAAAADGIVIRGEPEFAARTRAALALLRPSARWAEDRGAIKVIEQAPCSGMEEETKVYHVGRPTWSAEPLWYAGTIAHDSRHSYLYAKENAAARVRGRAPREKIWSGVTGERLCLAYQREVLKELGAPQWMIDYVGSFESAPKYQNVGADKTSLGTGGKDDVCNDRKW